jgi:o-succinylbenzoate synthase
MWPETRITAIDYYPYRLPFANSFITAHGPMKVREGAIVEVRTSDGITGIGEIAPLPDFGNAPLATILHSLPTLTAQLCGMSVHEALTTVLQKAQWQDSGRLDASLLCGLETALLDVQGKSEGCTVSALLAGRETANEERGRDRLSAAANHGRAQAVPTSENGIAPRAQIVVNAVVGTQTVAGAVQAAQEAQRQGFGCIKLKVGCMGSVWGEIERIATVRAALGPGVQLRLDANEAWGLAEATTILSACQLYDIQYVEQPLSREDLKGMHELRLRVALPIAADEAVGNLLSACRVIEQEAADILIIKPHLAGGLRMGQRILDEATQHGMQAVITTTIESGVSLAAAAHLAAASPSITLACGLATSHLLVDDLLIEELVVQHGVLSVPTGAGLGVTLNRDALYRYRVMPKML